MIQLTKLKKMARQVLYPWQETANNMMSTTRRSVAIAVIILALTPTALAAAPQTTDLTDQLRVAGAEVDRLQVSEIAGIVIIRGRVADKAQAEALGLYATSLG